MSAPASSLTVAAALALPELRRGLPEVVAGASSLDRRIRWVHAGEVPNMASLLHGGELLLTTGMGVGARAADQRRFVAELAERTVAALVIELGETFSERLPRALVGAAEQYGLPLVELHAKVRFVTVTEAIHTELVNHDYALLRRAAALQDRFTVVMLDGGGVPAVLGLLADTVGNPVFLETDDGRLLAYANPPSRSTDSDSVSAWSQAGKQASVVGVAVPVPSDSAPGNHGAGRLLALPIDRPLDPFARLALDRAAGIVALAFLRSRQEEELLALGRGKLLSNLAHGRMPPDMAAARAGDLGFAVRDGSMLLPMAARLEGTSSASPAHDGSSRTEMSSTWTIVLGDLERELSGLGVPVLLGLDGDGDLLLLVGLRDRDSRASVVERAAGYVRAALRRRGDRAVVVGAGPATTWTGTGLGLRDAIEACAVGIQLPQRPWFDAQSMPLDRLLWQLRDHHDVQRYVDRMLGPVLAHDAERKHVLLPTLEALCTHGGRKAETARALHLNRQALYDRISRLQEILQTDLSDTRNLLALHVAVEARRHRVGDARVTRMSGGRPAERRAT